MPHLLDVNVLVALSDAGHSHAGLALRYFEEVAVRDGWATCPLTENAFVRILGSTSYPDGPGSTNEARRILESLKAAPGHQFWPDDLSLCEASRFPDLPASGDLTDCYLLALAVAHGGRLATLDRRIDPLRVPGGAEALYIVGRA